MSSPCYQEVQQVSGRWGLGFAATGNLSTAARQLLAQLSTNEADYYHKCMYSRNAVQSAVDEL